MSDRLEPEFVREFVPRWADSVNRKDVDQLLSTCAAGIEFHDAAFPQPFVGLAEVRSLLLNIFSAFPDLRYDPVGEPFLSLDRTQAATRVHLTGTMTGRLDPPGFSATHDRIDFHAVEMFAFAGGKVARVDLVFNVVELGVQVGAVPAPGSAADRLGVRLQHLKALGMRRRRRSGSLTPTTGASS